MNTLRAILMLDQSGAKLTDESGNASGVSLELLFGAAVRLELDLRTANLDNNGQLSSYPIENLSGSAKYYFALNDGFNSGTTPKYLQFENAGVETVQGKTIFHVELPALNSEALSSAMAGKESAPFYCEFGGENSQLPPAVMFCFQFQLVIRNRIYPGAGSAVIAGDPAYYTALETEAAISRTISGGTDQGIFTPHSLTIGSNNVCVIPVVSDGAVMSLSVSGGNVSMDLDAYEISAGKVGRFTVLLNTSGAAMLHWPASWKWQGEKFSAGSAGLYPLEIYCSSGTVLARSFLDSALKKKIDSVELLAGWAVFSGGSSAHFADYVAGSGFTIGSGAVVNSALVIGGTAFISGGTVKNLEVETTYDTEEESATHGACVQRGGTVSMAYIHGQGDETANYYMSGGTVLLFSAGVSANLRLSNGYIERLLMTSLGCDYADIYGGVVAETVIRDDCTVEVHSGATLSNVTIDGGTLTVSAGGSAYGIHFISGTYESAGETIYEEE